MIPKRILHAEKHPVTLDHVRLPKTVYFHLTRRCNMSCVYCYMDAADGKPNELSTCKVKGILKEIVDLRIPRVVFTGGEPFLRRDMLRLAQYFKGIAPDSAMLCVNTNGALINASNVSLVAELFDEIRISIDGFEQQNDLLRGQGSYRCAINAIGELLRASVSPSINITLTAVNRDGIELFIRYMLHEWGVRMVRINPVKPLGRGKLETRLLLSDGETPTACDDEICSSTDCARGWACVGDTLSIVPEGRAYPCHWLCEDEFYLGNVCFVSIGSICGRMNNLRNKLLNADQ